MDARIDLISSDEDTENATRFPQQHPFTTSESANDRLRRSSNCALCNGLECSWLLWVDYPSLLLSACAGCAGCELLRTVTEPYKDIVPPTDLLSVKQFQINISESGLKIGLAHTSFDNAFKILLLHVSTPAGTDCPWRVVSHHPATLGVEDASAAQSMIRKWLLKCDRTHRRCHKTTAPDQTYLPTRVLELRGPRTIHLRVSSGQVRVPGRYACLSHCWGGTVPLRATASSIQTFQDNGIPWNDLPKTFQDAVDMTYRLGLKYLWIDSLCILQDSVDDWRHEGSKMVAIYSGAYVTLAATNAPGSYAGFYDAYRDDEYYHRHVVPDHRDADTSYQIVVRKDIQRYENDFLSGQLPLLTRAWAFQERLLSPRIVHFADDMLYWECKEVTACELDQYDVNENSMKEPIRMTKGANDPHFATSSIPGIEKSDMVSRVQRNWHLIVSQYTRCSLSFRQDMLPALQGVARYVQSERKCAYYAGIWQDNAWFDLLWYLQTPTAARHEDYRAPSWSWASAESDVRWPIQVEYYSQEASVQSINTVAAGDDPLGEITAGQLVLTGLALGGVIVGKDVLDDSSRKISKLCIRLDGYAVGTKWHPDYQHDLQDGHVVVVIVARLLHCAYCLVLAPTHPHSLLFKRVGFAELWVAPTSALGTHMEDTVDEDEYWPFGRNKCSGTYRQFTVI
ncbi:heterokaryon incompatibility protein-domain-containing protein [Paraphoma chrysanthemicola]|nr:heterokaryon incompatibility protein-domain-containing protein [Paraphoma chrysanthemicola]